MKKTHFDTKLRNINNKVSSNQTKQIEAAKSWMSN